MRAALVFALIALASSWIVSKLLGVPQDGYDLVWGLAAASGVGLILGICFLYWIYRQRKRNDS
jgi:membrane protein DedA with SNARE-associated domain